jgi:hypothetical protein
LVPSIRKTADLLPAMGRMDEVIRGNASAAAALTSAAQGMAAQAQALEQLVAFFHVDGCRCAAPVSGGDVPAV